ncbi:MAG: uroporphyrinogen decarboxylase family protein [Candidatus Helarchaeota archaeon]
MDSRTRSYNAMKCKYVDRIPLYLATSPWESDIVASMNFPYWRWKPPKKGFIPRTPSSYIYTRFLKGRKLYFMDEFGCIWYAPPENETIGQVIDPRVIKTWADLKNFKTPKKINKGRWWLSKFLFRVFGKSRFRLGSIDNFFFERMHFLRGFWNICVDIKRNKEKVTELGEKLADWYCWFVDQWAKFGADGIIATDDWGTETGTFISPSDFNKVIKPLYKQVTERIHDHGMLFMLHSCGNIYSLIPSLIDSGVDCLQLDSPLMTGLDRLKEFNGKISYCCVADIQKILPFKTPREVAAVVLQIIKKLGKGGLIGTNYADYTAINIPKRNMDISISTFRRFGKYGEYPLT